MSNVKKSLLLVFVLLLTMVPLALAQSAPVNTVAGVADSDGRFDTLAAAAAAAGLTDDLSGGTWTVFAPTDEAFAKLGLTADNIAEAYTAEELADLLLYHTLKGDNSTATLKTMLGNVTMANGGLAGLKFYEDALYVNDNAKLIEENVIVDNGRIHVVDNVILPPWPRVEDAQPTVQETIQAIAAKVVEAVPEAAEPVAEAVEAIADAPPVTSVSPNSIAGLAVADGRFNTLITAVIAADLLDDLVSGEWTAFAPTDAAFAKAGLNADNITTTYSQEELADLLLYHVMKGSNSTAQLKTQLGNVTMANGQLAGLKFYEDHLYVNDDAMIILENIVAENGTLHVVDNLILPPWPRE